jgi:hypothetical protein
MSVPDKCQMALKEWAVTCQALGDGEQILLLRKGGIHEDGKDFRVIHREFLLYPTYEHQKADLLRTEHQPALASLLEQPRDGKRITFSHFAVAEEVLEVEDQQKVDDLQPHYIWTTDYAQSRLRWKPMLPLSVMLLRAYQLEAPVTVPWLPEYSGCTSWVEVLTDVPLGRLEPVLTDAEFAARVDAIKGSLGLAVAAG